MRNSKDMNRILKHLDRKLGDGMKKKACEECEEGYEGAQHDLPSTSTGHSGVDEDLDARESEDIVYPDHRDVEPKPSLEHPRYQGVKQKQHDLGRDDLNSPAEHEELEDDLSEELGMERVELPLAYQSAKDSLALQTLHGLAKIASELETTNPKAAELVDATLERIVAGMERPLPPLTPSEKQEADHSSVTRQLEHDFDPTPDLKFDAAMEDMLEDVASALKQSRAHGIQISFGAGQELMKACAEFVKHVKEQVKRQKLSDY